MIPAIGGGLTNSGSMPITGGAAGDATANSKNSIGGQKFGPVNFGASLTTKVLLGVAVAALAYVAVKK